MPEHDGNGERLFPQTVQAIRKSLEAGLRSVFWISAITMLLSFFIILTLPEISLDTEAQDSKVVGSAASPQPVTTG